MASTKLKDLAVKVGTYTDRNSGQEKGRYENIGALMQSDDGSMFVMLKRTFNPAGVPSDRESILVSAFDPQPRDGQGGGQNAPRQERQQPTGGNGFGAGGRPDMDDEIPFRMEWR